MSSYSTKGTTSVQQVMQLLDIIKQCNNKWNWAIWFKLTGQLKKYILYIFVYYNIV